jgi:small-conductance mechanosensitive channel
MDFWKELFLSAIKSLTNLSYNRPEFAQKILSTLFRCWLLVHISILAYHSGYKDCQTHISNELSHHLSRPRLSKSQRKQLNSSITIILKGSASPIANTIKTYIPYSYIVGSILVVLIMFCYIVDKQLLI